MLTPVKISCFVIILTKKFSSIYQVTLPGKTMHYIRYKQENHLFFRENNLIDHKQLSIRQSKSIFCLKF